MRITFIGHASLLVETNGVRVVSDPWWTGPCFGVQWWLYPKPYLDPVQERPPDYIYISHGHNDHFHSGTLATLNRKSKVLVSRDTGLAAPIRQLGFPVIEVSKDRNLDLGNGVTARIMPTIGHDTLMAISDGRETCINLNDALHATSSEVQDHFIYRLRTLYAPIDYVFCGYAKASHFPDCYFIPGKDRAASAAKRQRHFNAAWARIVDGLRPQLAFPFAGDVVLLENELFSLNEVIHNCERATRRFLADYGPSMTRVIDIAPGFVVADGAVVVETVRQPVSNESLISLFAREIEKANQYHPIDRRAVEEAAELLKENIRLCYPYLKTFRGDYQCLIRLRNAVDAIEITKRREDIVTKIVSDAWARATCYEVIYTTRLSYLKKSLTTTYGHELLFVGSGGIFEYTERSTVRRGIHREIAVALSKHEACPHPRPGALALRAKQLVKRALGRQERDLYDLDEWTVYTSR